MSNLSYDFGQQLEKGKKGEIKVAKILINHLKNKGCDFQYEFVEHFKNNRTHECDLVLKDENGKLTKIEVKSDDYTTGNIVLETISVVEKNKIGCIEASDSDCFAYDFVNYKKIYVIKTKLLKKFLVENLHRYRQHTTGTKDEKTGVILYHTAFILVRIFDLEKALGKKNMFAINYSSLKEISS